MCLSSFGACLSGPSLCFNCHENIKNCLATYERETGAPHPRADFLSEFYACENGCWVPEGGGDTCARSCEQEISEIRDELEDLGVQKPDCYAG